MPSDFIRGMKMGAGCLVGAGALLLLLLFGMAMCAGHFEERMLEELKEQLEEFQPRETPDTDSVRYLECLRVRQTASRRLYTREEGHVSRPSIRPRHTAVLSRL